MKARNILTSAITLAALAAAGCAQDGTMTTQATPEKSITQSAAKIDPACTTLAGQIDTLRKEASIEGLEKAATGKSKNVDVKRSALAKQAELNKANADFQAKCAPQAKAQSAQSAPGPADAGKKTATAAATTAAVAPAPAAAAAKDAAMTAAKDAAKEAVKKAP